MHLIPVKNNILVTSVLDVIMILVVQAVFLNIVCLVLTARDGQAADIRNLGFLFAIFKTKFLLGFDFFQEIL